MPDLRHAKLTGRKKRAAQLAGAKAGPREPPSPRLGTVRGQARTTPRSQKAGQTITAERRRRAAPPR